MRGLQRVGLAVAVGMVCALASANVSAQALRSVRLRVDPTLFEYVRQVQEIENIPDSRSKVSSQTFGLFSSNVALGIGTSPNNNVNLGLNALIAATSVTISPGDAESEANATTIWLVPYAEYVFNGKDARGFLGLHAGLGSATASIGAGETSTGIVGTLGVSGGFHYFVNEHVSFDPHLRFLYTAGSVEDVDLSGIAFGIVLGLSAWMGESKAERDDEGVPTRHGREGDAFASARRAAPAPQGNPLAVRRGREGTLNGTITVSGVQVDLMADVAHPDVIALRFQRLTPVHRGATINCPAWTILLDDTRTEISGAVYKGEPEGPGVRESLKSHVPADALRQLVATPNYSEQVAAFDVCGERLNLSLSNRVDLSLFFKRFYKLLQLSGATTTPTPETPAEPPIAPETIDVAPAQVTADPNAAPTPTTATPATATPATPAPPPTTTP